MTRNEAAVMGQSWEQRAFPIPSEQVNLELERNDRRHATDNYVCILCGEFVAQRPA